MSESSIGDVSGIDGIGGIGGINFCHEKYVKEEGWVGVFNNSKMIFWISFLLFVFIFYQLFYANSYNFFLLGFIF